MTEPLPSAALEDLAPLPRAFYARPTVEVAQDLLGKLLLRTRRGRTQVARIVEVEAYLGERDAASHARRGPTARSAIMFGPPGFLYVYLIYGMHHCMNFVCEADGVAGAALIRAAEPLRGFDQLRDPQRGPLLPRRARTGEAGASPRAAADPRPASGPGKLCAALGITLADKGRDLTRAGDFFVADAGGPRPRRATSRRIGVDYAGAWAARKLRFYVPGNPYVSGRPR